MKTLTILIILLTSMQILKSQNAEEQLLYEGKLVNIYLEKAIYHSAGQVNFLLKFRIENKSDKVVGVDLRGYWKVFYPNQWGIYTKPYREVIDERRMIVAPIKTHNTLVNDYKQAVLAFIEPGSAIAYYRDWNGSGEKAELDNPDGFFIITIDGQVLATDGKRVEQAIPGEEDEQRAIAFKYPLIHETVPENALIVGHN